MKTGNFIITMKGQKIQDSITICNRLRIKLRIRPYVEPVIQCFNCFMYGHVKAKCKKVQKCIVCGDREHGECTKSVYCINCGGEHKSTSRTCTEYKINKDIKGIMAQENMSYIEARNMYKIR